MAGQEFYRPGSLTEACDLLARFGDEAQILAGGTDLMVKVNRRLASPAVLVYIGDSGLSYVRMRGMELAIGSATPLSTVANSELVRRQAPLLVEAILSVGSPAIRNVATLGGNLVNASPAADPAVALLALGASFRLVCQGSERLVPAEAFFTGPGQTVRRPDELLQEVIVPGPTQGTRWGYRKLGRRQSDTLSVVVAAVCLEMPGTLCTSARIALGAVAPIPMLARKAAGLLVDERLKADLIARVAEMAAEETSPIDDARASAWYRRRASQALVKGLLEQFLG